MDMILYIKDSKDIIRKLLELTKSFFKVGTYKFNTQNHYPFYIPVTNKLEKNTYAQEISETIHLQYSF